MQDTDVTVPGLTEVQLRALEKQFPDQSADLKDTDREVWHKAGQVSVVKFLREQYRRENETQGI